MKFKLSNRLYIGIYKYICLYMEIVVSKVLF